MRSKQCPICHRVVRKGQKWAIKSGKVVHSWCKEGNVKCPHCSFIIKVQDVKSELDKQLNIAAVLSHMAIEHREVFNKAMSNQNS